MDFRILGPVEVCRDGQPLPLVGTKRRALLAILLLHANEVVSPDRLVDELWGERPPQNAAAALHNHVSRLRKLLGSDVLTRHPGGYRLEVDPPSIDLHRFERLVGDADAAGPEERAALLHEALAVWRGPALADLTFEPVARSAAPRLEEARLAALESRIEADLALARHADLVAELEGLVAEHPLRERMHGQLILSLYRSGRQADALEVYRQTRRVLADELGLDPSPELRELERAILRQDPALASPPKPTAPPAAPRRRRTEAVVAFAVLALLAVAAAAAALALRAGGPARVASREPVRVTPPAASPISADTTAVAPAAPAAESKPKPRTEPRAEHRRSTVPVAQSKPANASPRVTAPQATETQRPTTKPKPKPKPAPAVTAPAEQQLRITDDFSAGFPDPLVWHYVGRENGASFGVRSGRLEIAVAPDAKADAQWNQVGGHVGTRCRFDGNFDARVDFELLQWPTGSNVYAGLNAIYADSAVVRQASSKWGDNYASWVIPANAGVELSDKSGRLRVRRVGAAVTTYFWNNGGWVRLASGTSRGTAVLALQAQADGNEFARVPVHVAFDNFVVEAPDADCPPGSDPRDA